MAEHDMLAPTRERFAAAGVTEISFPGPALPVPAWLNLDAIVAPETREEIVNLIIEGQQLEPTIRDFAQRVRRVRIDFEQHDGRRSEIDCSRSWRSVEDVYDMVQYLIGGRALYEVVAELVGHLEAAVELDGGTTPDWAKEMEPEREDVA
jgi:hypothetical protein